MAHVHHDTEAQEYHEEQEIHHSHATQYVVIFFILLFITAVEIAIPIVNSPEIALTSLPKQLEVGLLLALMTIKGFAVGMFYMHLKGDRRMFGSLFVFPMILVLAMVLGFMFLFQPVLW